MQNLYAEDYIILINQRISKYRERHTAFMDWKTHHNKDASSSKLINCFNSMTIKNKTARVLLDINKIILKLTCKDKGPRADKNNFEKRNDKGRNLSSWFQNWLYSWSSQDYDIGRGTNT